MDANVPQGLFDGFEGYRTPSDEDYNHALRNGLVVPDTNVLLNVYRYNAEAQNDLFAIFDNVGDRLWVPHQVLAEFWRNREAAIRDPQIKAEQTSVDLQDQCERALQLVRAWANRIALPDDRLTAMQDSIAQAFNELVGSIRNFEDVDAIEMARNTNSDPVLRRLEPLLRGRVGMQPNVEDLAQMVKEGLRRVEMGAPPGYRDKAKEGDAAAGDFLVWGQVLREAKKRGKPVLFVTGDVKEDWWRRVGGEIRGPRPELVSEMWRTAGVPLFMMQPKRLMRLAVQALHVQVQAGSLEDVARVDSMRVNPEPSELIPSSIWEQVLSELFREADEINWESLTSRGKSDQYDRWVESPLIGGALSRYLPSGQIRPWLKDGPMKEYLRAREGLGNFAAYMPKQHMQADDLVRQAMGPGWRIIENSLGDKPGHCHVTDGSIQRYVCWGWPANFRQLIWSAVEDHSNDTGSPVVIVTLREGEPISPEEQQSHLKIGDRFGFQVIHLIRPLLPAP
ncbi:PIN-like domain-containing protein [Micromonospora parva]|uniref:PIN-like domain-containing protein n=1 Tax=Micromonospora parva TaxID=1464048 RepID=UPI0033C8466A